MVKKCGEILSALLSVSTALAVVVGGYFEVTGATEDTIDDNMHELDVVEDIFHYIPEIPENDLLEISEFVLLSPGTGREVNNNEISEDNNDNKTSDEYCCVTRAKRGRPPSKPPTKEIVSKRRKVCYCSIILKQALIHTLSNIKSPCGCPFVRLSVNTF